MYLFMEILTISFVIVSVGLVILYLILKDLDAYSEFKQHSISAEATVLFIYEENREENKIDILTLGFEDMLGENYNVDIAANQSEKRLQKGDKIKIRYHKENPNNIKLQSDFFFKTDYPWSE